MLYLLNGRITTGIIWNSSAQEMNLFSPSFYLLIQVNDLFRHGMGSWKCILYFEL